MGVGRARRQPVGPEQFARGIPGSPPSRPPCSPGWWTARPAAPAPPPSTSTRLTSVPVTEAGVLTSTSSRIWLPGSRRAGSTCRFQRFFDHAVAASPIRRPLRGRRAEARLVLLRGPSSITSFTVRPAGRVSVIVIGLPSVGCAAAVGHRDLVAVEAAFVPRFEVGRRGQRLDRPGGAGSPPARSRRRQGRGQSPRSRGALPLASSTRPPLLACSFCLLLPLPFFLWCFLLASCGASWLLRLRVAGAVEGRGRRGGGAGVGASAGGLQPASPSQVTAGATGSANPPPSR